MSVEHMFTRLHKGGKQQGHLRAAKLLAFASLFATLVLNFEIVTKVWMIAFVDLALAVFLGYSACISYALSRKAGDE